MAVYYFNATDSSITECLFVEAKQNYELLKRDVEDLNYISTDRNYFYVCVDGSVYGIDFATHQAEVLVSGLKEGCYGSSRTGRYLPGPRAPTMLPSLRSWISIRDRNRPFPAGIPSGYDT